MASIENDMLTLVKSITGVTAYVGSGANARVYVTDAPDGTVTLPYIVLFTVASAGGYMYVGKASSLALIQFSVRHDHLANGLNCANALFTGLSGYGGTPAGKYVHYISCNGPRILRDPDYDNIYQFIVEASVEYDR